MNKDEILEFWLSLCPDNMDRECCAQYLKHDVSIPEECLYTINRLGNIWYASNEKRRLANHNQYYVKYFHGLTDHMAQHETAVLRQKYSLSC